MMFKLKANQKRTAIQLWNYIVSLIEDAFILYDNRKYSSACFMAFTAFEELGKLNKFLLGIIHENQFGERINKRFSYSHPEKHFFAISGHLSVSSHITYNYRKEEKWFTSKFQKDKKDYGLMKLRNNFIYYDKNNIPSKKFKIKDAKSMIIIALEALYQTEGFMDKEFTKKDIILKCQKDLRFSKKLFRR